VLGLAAALVAVTVVVVVAAVVVVVVVVVALVVAALLLALLHVALANEQKQMHTAITMGKRMVKSICCEKDPNAIHESGSEIPAMFTLKTSKIDSTFRADFGKGTT